MRRILFLLLALYTFAVPWEYSLDLGEPIGNIARLLGLLLLASVLLMLLLKRSVRRFGALQGLVLAFFLYFVFTLFWTIDLDTSLDKARAYFQVMMVVWLGWEIVDSGRQLRWLVRAFCAGCAVLAILSASTYFSVEAMAAEQIRYYAVGQDPNDIARFLDLGLPLAALLFLTEKPAAGRWLALAYLPLGLMAVVLTASRGGFSAALLAVAGVFAMLMVWKPRAAILGVLGLGSLAVVGWLMVPSESLARLATIPEQVSGGDLNDRMNIWTAGLHALHDAPWFGSGAGTYSAAAGLSPGDTAHNTVMAIVVTGGLTGLAIFCAIVQTTMRSIWQTGGVLRLSFAIAFAVWLITSMVGSVEENRNTWLLFAMMAIAGRLAVEQPLGMAEEFYCVRPRLVSPSAAAVV